MNISKDSFLCRLFCTMIINISEYQLILATNIVKLIIYEDTNGVPGEYLSISAGRRDHEA